MTEAKQTPMEVERVIEVVQPRRETVQAGPTVVKEPGVDRREEGHPPGDAIKELWVVNTQLRAEVAALREEVAELRGLLAKPPPPRAGV